VSDIFPDVKDTITDKELGEMYKLNFNSIILQFDDLPYTSTEYGKYGISMRTDELGIIKPSDTIHVTLTEN